MVLRLEHSRQRLAAALTDHHDNLALARLVDAQATVLAILAEVRGLHVSAEVGAINFGFGTIVADLATLHFLRHCLAQLVRQHERRLVGQAKIAAHGQHALALHFVAEDGDRREVQAQRQLVAGEQRARRDREILAAILAAPARRTGRAAALVDRQRSAVRTDRIAVLPADALEGGLSIRVVTVVDLTKNGSCGTRSPICVSSSSILISIGNRALLRRTTPSFSPSSLCGSLVVSFLDPMNGPRKSTLSADVRAPIH
jgi:hypothetical protein